MHSYIFDKFLSYIYSNLNNYLPVNVGVQLHIVPFHFFFDTLKEIPLMTIGLFLFLEF